jgi:2-polyprenyl-6-methoxyphenol hydroxylase-like FAD-dependent oxidoreductase
MNRPLIVGSGPTGLAAALLLSHRGVTARIVDAADQPSKTSKALGVNPRTMQVLEATGVDEAIAAEGLAMRTLHVHFNGRSAARIEIPIRKMGAKHPMTILPQARTEALLTRALAERGIEVERGLALTAVSQDEDGVTATAGGETIRAPILLGADGAHSAVRHALDIGFPGAAMPEDWRLMDLKLEGPPPNAGWVDFRDDGPFVALPFDATTWRLIGFGPPLLERLPQGWKAGEVLWESGFHVSHRVADRFNIGRICLAGDAAHIHSPIGARGMNLGIEDAWAWAVCAKAFIDGDAFKLAAYGEDRRAVDKAVVERVRRLTDTARATRGAGALFRRIAVPVLAAFMPARVAIARQAVGLDHPLKAP